jgi:hypothetical protein
MQRHSSAMHTPTLLPAFVLVLGLASCEKAAPPPVVQTPPAVVQDDAQLIAARDALEIETRSALLDKQLADMEQKLRQTENDALRGQLDAMKQQNEQLRAQADTARQQSDQLSRRLVATTPPAPPVLPPQSTQRDYSLFYDRLAPHGRWLDVSGYGLCFQPRLSRTTTWRPYVDGCWSWSTLGWTWQSNEPFGWATYHYGRWIHLTRHGWLWVPGCEWAPAWVAWRQSRDYIGWAPLPPEPGPCTSIQRDCDTRYNLGPASYTFISVTNFVRPTYTTICRPVSYNSTIFHHTVNSTQIVPCGGPAQGGTPLFMHHGGPPRHQIEQQCRQTIPQTQLRPVEHAHLTAGDLPEGGRKPGKPHLLPVIDLPTLSSRPSRPSIKPAEHIERPQLADTFAGVPETARPAIQQTLEADRKRPLIADSPHPAPASPSPQPVLSTPQLTETVRPAQPVEVQNSPASPLEPAQVPPALANLGAPLEKRGGRPHLVAPAAPGEAPNIPTTLPTPAVVEVPAAPAMPPVVEKPSLTPPTTPEPTIAAAPASPTPLDQAPTAPMSQPAAPPTAPDQTAADAAEQQARQQAEALAMQQKQAEQAAAEQQARQQAEALAMQQKQAEEAAARAAAEEQMRQAQIEAQRQAQMEAQRQAEEAQRRAQEEAMRQAQMEAQRQAEEAQRRAQEEAQRQAQMEAQRQAQMEAQRQAEEAARRAQEEAQRQAQMEAQRQAQMEAQRQAEEAARRAAEEAQRQAEAAARAAAEAAARPNPPQ